MALRPLLLRAGELTPIENYACCAPGFEPVTLTNLRPDAPSFVFIADESPLHRQRVVYGVRGGNDAGVASSRGAAPAGVGRASEEPPALQPGGRLSTKLWRCISLS